MGLFLQKTNIIRDYLVRRNLFCIDWWSLIWNNRAVSEEDQHHPRLPSEGAAGHGHVQVFGACGCLAASCTAALLGVKSVWLVWPMESQPDWSPATQTIKPDCFALPSAEGYY